MKCVYDTWRGKPIEGCSRDELIQIINEMHAAKERAAQTVDKIVEQNKRILQRTREPRSLMEMIFG